MGKLTSHNIFLAVTGVFGCLGLIISALLFFIIPEFGDTMIFKEFRFLIMILPIIPFFLTLSLLIAYLKAGEQKLAFATSIITVALPALLTESFFLRGSNGFPHFFWYSLVGIYTLFLVYIFTMLMRRKNK